MTRTIEMQSEFEGTDHRFRVRFDDGVTIEVRPTPYGEEGKYIAMSAEDFEHIISEYENFKKLNASLEAA